jgi:adenosylcobinamide-phosphate synthase
VSLIGFFAGSALVALTALLIERIFGYPHALFRVTRHPAVWMGAVISALDANLNRPAGRSAKLRGVVTVAALLAVTAAVAVPLAILFRSIPFGFLAEGLLAASLLAQKDLGRRVADVAKALAHGVEPGRRAVGHIVGRDTDALDEAGICRAAIESLAENTSDGVVAPLFWLLVGGLPGAALHKAINTADSMIGYRSERYRRFGWAAARLDDLVNWPAARLTGLLFAAAAALGGGNGAVSLAAMRRDAARHASPNAGWPEAAFAGALGFRLGGPRSYRGRMVDYAPMGDGRADLGPEDIGKALALYRRTLDVLAGVTLALALLAILFA